MAILVLGRQILCHQHQHGGQEALCSVIEVGVLSILGTVPAAGVDERFGKDFSVLFSFGFGGQIFWIGLVNIHVPVDQMEQIVPV